MKKSFLNTIAAFFNSLGTKGASGEPVNDEWTSRQSARVEKKENQVQEELEDDKRIELSIDLTEEPPTTKPVKEVTESSRLSALRNLMKNTQWTAQQAAAALGFSQEDTDRLLQKL